MLPVYRRTTSNEHSSIETLARILLDSDTAVSTGKLKVCSSQTVQVCHNVTFLVDLNALDDPVDTRADENDRKGSPVSYISLHKNGGTSVCINERSWDVTQIKRLQRHLLVFIISRLHNDHNGSIVYSSGH